jgi:hypothetical protein
LAGVESNPDFFAPNDGLSSLLNLDLLPDFVAPELLLGALRLPPFSSLYGLFLNPISVL